jgi:hypothetical protein
LLRTKVKFSVADRILAARYPPEVLVKLGAPRPALHFVAPNRRPLSGGLVRMMHLLDCGFTHHEAPANGEGLQDVLEAITTAHRGSEPPRFLCVRSKPVRLPSNPWSIEPIQMAGAELIALIRPSLIEPWFNQPWLFFLRRTVAWQPCGHRPRLLHRIVS